MMQHTTYAVVILCDASALPDAHSEAAATHPTKFATVCSTTRFSIPNCGTAAFNTYITYALFSEIAATAK